MLEIVKYPDPRLKEIAKPVSGFDKNLVNLLEQMAKTMYAANGVGLAAPQVGSLLRLFIVDIGGFDEEEKKLYEFINPKLSGGEGAIEYDEGCLSIPNYTQGVERFAKIRVDYQDRQGKSQTLIAEDLLAVAIQHENDHLDGILLVDHLSAIKRKLVKRQLSKALAM